MLQLCGDLFGDDTALPWRGKNLDLPFLGSFELMFALAG